MKCKAPNYILSIPDVVEEGGNGSHLKPKGYCKELNCRLNMSFDTELIKKSREYVQAFLKDNSRDNLYYHNLEHTRVVVDAAEEIGKATGLNTEELETVIIAAWFHDAGYARGVDEHEIISKQIAEEFLRKQGIPEKRISEVAGCIIATKMPQRPTTLPEEVLCDADLYHISSKEFFTKSELLRKELSVSGENEIKDVKWFKKSLKFLKKHNFYTTYAKEKLLPEKDENLRRLKSILEDYQQDNRPAQEKDNPAELRLSPEKPDRGIETLFRITSRNHIDFSTMADNKANIMISINSIMLSIIFSVLFRRFEELPNLILPSIILAITCLTTIIFAIIATRPNFTSGIFFREDITKRKANLLFFGNFHRMPQEDYEWGMKQVIEDKEFLYGSIIRDIYFLGVVLGRKYRLLRISYTIFMFGLIISVLAFALSVLYVRNTGV